MVPMIPVTTGLQVITQVEPTLRNKNPSPTPRMPPTTANMIPCFMAFT